MAERLRERIVEGVALIALDAPPVNALDASLRAALLAALARAADDGRVRALVLLGVGRLFSAGSDLRETDSPRPPSVATLCDAVERAPKPVIAALPGPALGAAADLALACHWRLAAPGASLAWPEIALRLLPEGGATQRLPRLAGAALALDLLIGGAAIEAEPARRAGLIDGLVEGDLASGALAYARALLDRGAGPRPTLARRERMEPAAWLAATARARRAQSDPAAIALTDCVEAALLLPPAQGLAYEAARREEAAAGPAARALRHLFLAERRAPPALLARGDPRGGPGSRRLTPAGEALVEGLGRAMGRAAGALARAGVARGTIDAALVDWGLPIGPFGGQSGGAGAAGAAIVRRINAAVAAEGARLLAEGAAGAPGDLDALAVAGLGVPRLSGGPMWMAEVEGLPALIRDMAGWERDDPVWSVPPLLAAAAEAGGWAGAATPRAA